MQKTLLRVFVIALIAMTVSCGPAQESSQDSSPTVIATTSIVADLLNEITPSSIEVVGLMGPGTDPHLYKPTFSDFQAIESTQFLVLSGMHLEGKMADVMMDLNGEKNVLELTQDFTEEDKINSTDFADGHDPHFWMDVTLWMKSATTASVVLMEWFPEKKDSINLLTQAYINQLQQLNEEVQKGGSSIPDSLRIIITSHDALNYFARAYEYQVKSLQGFSTAAEFGLKDVSDLVDYIIDNRIPSVFVENIVSDQALKAVVEGCSEKGWEVSIGGSLYTDALGEKGSGADSYIGMIRHNAQTIRKGLAGNE